MRDAVETQSTPKVQTGEVSSLLLSQEYSIIYVEVNKSNNGILTSHQYPFAPRRRTCPGSRARKNYHYCHLPFDVREQIGALPHAALR
jgi:hypothetical protein